MENYRANNWIIFFCEIFSPLYKSIINYFPPFTQQKQAIFECKIFQNYSPNSKIWCWCLKSFFDFSFGKGTKKQKKWAPLKKSRLFSWQLASHHDLNEVLKNLNLKRLKSLCVNDDLFPLTALLKSARAFLRPLATADISTAILLSLLFTLFKKRCWSNSHFSLFLHCLKNLVSFLEKCFQKKILCLLY